MKKSIYSHQYLDLLLVLTPQNLCLLTENFAPKRETKNVREYKVSQANETDMDLAWPLGVL